MRAASFMSRSEFLAKITLPSAVAAGRITKVSHPQERAMLLRIGGALEEVGRPDRTGSGGVGLFLRTSGAEEAPGERMAAKPATTPERPLCTKRLSALVGRIATKAAYQSPHQGSIFRQIQLPRAIAGRRRHKASGASESLKCSEAQAP